MTGIVVLLALAPSGFYLSLFAKGSLAGTLGFVLSGVIVVVAMVQGIRTARAGNYAAHRRQAAHVLAQLSVAVTSRAMRAANGRLRSAYGTSRFRASMDWMARTSSTVSSGSFSAAGLCPTCTT